MANEKRNIEANTLREEISSLRVTVTGLRAGKGVLNEYMKQYRESVLRIIDEQPTVDAVELPCKMGDQVWGIKKFNHETKQVKQGIVHMMFFGEDMRLCICVKGVCRGEWGKNVFATEEEALAKMGGSD